MMNVMVKRTLVVLLLSVAGFTRAAAGPVQVDTLKIGVVSALTGPGSEWGLAMDGAAKIMAMEVNAKGGLKVGSKTYKVEVISYDDQYKAALAVTGATRLIEQDKVKFVVGPLGSAALLAVKPLWERNKMLAIIGSYTDKALDANTKYMFRACMTQVEYANPIVQWLKKNRPALKTIAELEPNDETGWFSQKLLKERYESAGYILTASELFERSLKDFQPLLTRILATKPDIIELGMTPPTTAGLVVRQARELGFKGQFVKIGSPGAREIVAAAGKEFTEDLIGYGAADITKPEYKNLASEYAKVLKPPMNQSTVCFYNSVSMMFDAIQTAGTVEDTDKVRTAMENLTQYKGLQGNIHWGGMKSYGSNHQVLSPTFIGAIRDGKEVIIDRIE